MDYQRDAIGRISAINSTWAGSLETLATQKTYLPFGPVETFSLGNGLQEQRSYDQAFRLTDQVTAGFQDRVYHYDAAGNILAIDQNQGTTSLALTDPDAVAETSTDTGDIAEEDITTANGDTQSAQTASSYNYVYDGLHRLTDETSPYGQRVYSYDANGNRQTRDKVDQLYDQNNLPTTTVTRNQSYSYPLDSQQLTQISTVKNGNTTTRDLGYDAAGNTVSKHTKNFAYDARNRVKSYSKNGVLVAEYRYNAQGERIEKIKHKADGTIRTLHFHYDQNGQLLGLTRYNNSGLLKAHKDIIWLDNMPVAQITTRYHNDGSEKSRQVVYLHTDHLNTPRIATDVNQTVVWRWDSDAFGQGKPDTDPDNNGKKTFVPLRFPGQIASERGLYYNYFRYYDPKTGRYITSDPIGLAGGLNTYGYVGGNPNSYVDPLGLLCIPKTGCYTTPQEMNYISRGEYLGFYDLACSSGDSYACFARDIAANKGWDANATTNRLRSALQDAAEENKQCIAEDTIMENIRIKLAAAYANYLPQNKDSARFPTDLGVAEFRWKVFAEYGMPASTFGGTPFGKTVGPIWSWYWCPNCK